MANLLQHAHQIIQTHLQQGDIAIDATIGNGHDTLFLAQQVTAIGKVYGFDIQAAAIYATQQRLKAANVLDCVQLMQIGHQFMAQYIPISHHQKIKAIMFNLGYLPHGDKNMISQAETTLLGLEAAKQLLALQGVMSILAYPGHLGGDIETVQVARWCDDLPKNHFRVQLIESEHRQSTAPRLFVVEKKISEQSNQIGLCIERGGVLCGANSG